jgi:molybdopterin converting factor subunit 1
MLRVRLFGELRERAGWGEQQVSHAYALTPSQLWQTIAAELGATPDLPARIRVAVNQQFSDANVALCNGDEVAFLPPISGG